MMRLLINMAVIFPVLAEETTSTPPPVKEQCSIMVDPATTPEQLLVNLEIQKTREAIKFYEGKAKELEESIARSKEADLIGNKTHTHSLVLRNQDLEYLLNLNEHEIINTPENKIMAEIDDTKTFAHPHVASDANDNLQVQPLILHEMLHIPE